jgi:hypothetical protein
MEGAKKQEDKLNMIGIVVVGICGAVLVYVSIVLLEAFYVNDTADLNRMADYGGQETQVMSVKAAQRSAIDQDGRNTAAPGEAESFRIKIDHAMDLVAKEAAVDPSDLIPVVGPSTKPTIKPAFGRPILLTAPAPAPTGAGSGSAGAGAGSAAAPASGSGSAAAPAAGSGSAAAPAAGSGSGASAAGSGSGVPAAPAPGGGNAP